MLGWFLGHLPFLAPAGAAASRPATDDVELKKDATSLTRGSRNTRGWRDQGRPCDQLCDIAQFDAAR